jgi:hypothetical protein
MNSILTNHWNTKELHHFYAPPGVCRGLRCVAGAACAGVFTLHSSR